MADRVVGNLAIRLDFDGAKFEQGITKAKRELSTYNKATQASTRIAKSDNYEKGKSAVALNNMQVQYKGLQGTLQAHADMNKKLIEQGKENSGAFEKNENAMRNYEVQMWELNEQYKQFQKEMYTANSGFTKMGDAMNKVGGAMQTFGSGLTEIGTGITKVGAMASASLGLVAKMAIEFEEGMVQVQKTTNASAEEMAVFEEQIRGLALAMPLAVGELAEVAALAGQLGIAQEDIAGFTETMAMLGTATNLSAEEAGNALARFQNVTGTSVDTVENLGSAIVHLGNNFATQEDSIINLGMMLAGSMTTVGAAETDILGLSAAMSALGITAERGGSSMSKFFVDMASDVSNGADSLDTFSKVAGMSKQAFTDLFNQDSMAAVEAFIVGLGGVGESGGDMLAVLADLDIGEVRLRDTILRLANGHEVLSEALDYSKQGFEDNIALTEEYELLAGTTASQIQIAKNQLQDLAITAGQELLPAIMDLLNNSDGIIDMLKGAVDWFVSLDDEMKQNLVKWSAMALVIGPVVSGLGNVISGLGGLVTIGGAANKAIGRLDGALKAKAAGGLVEATVASQGLAGSGGLGGVITAITGSTGLLWALGLAGAALGGWTLWKTWGEDAWEAGQRTKRWGTDVSESVGEALGSVSDHSQTATGMFTLLKQGVKVDSGEMIGNFESMGRVIEESLVTRISNLDELIEGLPSTLENTLGKVMSEDKEAAEESLEEIKKYNERISEIRSTAAENNRNISVLEAKQIQDLTKASAAEYVKTLGLTKDEQQELLHVMTGDVENASAEQATAMAKGLGKQRQVLVGDRAEKRKLFKESLEEQGFYSEARIDELMTMWDQGNQTITNGIDEQLRLIAEKYPHIVDEVLFANGQMIDSHADYASSAVTKNREIIDAAYEMSATLEYQAVKNAERMQWMGDEATEMGRVWNGLILDEHGMLVESNAREAVIEAAANIDTWNKYIQPQLKNADLHSNAKLIIGEAAIANGLWDSMRYEDKMAVLEDNFSITLYEALRGTEVWNNIIAERKSAVLRNEFGQTLTQALIDFGTWDDLDPLIQEAVLTTNTPETLQQVLEDIGMWESLDPDIQDLIANSQPVKDATGEAERMLDEYGNIIVGRPVMGVTDNVTSEVERLQRRINQLQGKIVYIDAIARAGGSQSSRRFIESGGSLLYARGTNNHPGGLAMVNDQMGSLYRELVTLPDGQSFIPKGRNVVLDLPEGSKVLRAALTKMKIPKYRDGIGHSRQQTQQIISGSNTDMSQTNSLLNTLIQLVGQGQVINLDGDQVGKTMYPRIDSTMSSNMQRNQIMNMGG